MIFTCDEYKSANGITKNINVLDYIIWITSLDFSHTTMIFKWFGKYGFLSKTSADTNDGAVYHDKSDAYSISNIQHLIHQMHSDDEIIN